MNKVTESNHQSEIDELSRALDQMELSAYRRAMQYNGTGIMDWLTQEEKQKYNMVWAKICSLQNEIKEAI